MHIINESQYSKIDDAILMVKDKLPKIIEALHRLPPGSQDFSYTNLGNHAVAAMLYNAFYRSNVSLKIKVQKTKWPWSKAIGWTNGTEEIFINGWKINSLSVQDIAGNIAHEFCHFPGRFQHGNNTLTTLKKLSVPYAIGYLVSGEAKFPLDKYRPM